MRLLIAFAALCLSAFLGAQPVQAGAWPREKGTGFATIATHLSWPQDLTTLDDPAPDAQYRMLYFEYGLTERLTLGLDLGRSVSGDGKAVGFVQLPLRRADGGMQATAQIGLGQISGAPVVRPGLSLGWGMERGWVSMDSVAEIQIESGQTDIKLDVTWGRTLPRDRKLMVQLQTGAPARDPSFGRIAPSVVLPLRKTFQAELGATYGLWGDDSMGVRLGLWTDF